MQKIHYSIKINAPKEKVWDTMLGDETFRRWTDVFAKGSHFEGSWDEGSKIVFLAPDENGKMGGMVSEIAANTPYEFISIKHLGIVNDGMEDTTSAAVKDWAGAYENYTFKEQDGVTEVLVDMDTNDEYKEMFEETWPKALEKLKTLAEG